MTARERSLRVTRRAGCASRARKAGRAGAQLGPGRQDPSPPAPAAPGPAPSPRRRPPPPAPLDRRPLTARRDPATRRPSPRRLPGRALAHRVPLSGARRDGGLGREGRSSRRGRAARGPGRRRPSGTTFPPRRDYFAEASLAARTAGGGGGGGGAPGRGTPARSGLGAAYTLRRSLPPSPRARPGHGGVLARPTPGAPHRVR